MDKLKHVVCIKGSESDKVRLRTVEQNFDELYSGKAAVSRLCVLNAGRLYENTDCCSFE
jgi:hypothetical protein